MKLCGWSNHQDPVQDTEEVEVFPLTNIPVGVEDPDTDIVHDGVNPCGDPTCYCATYGYEEGR